MKKKYHPALIGLALILVISLFHLFKKDFSPLSLSNSLFLVGLPFLVIGGFLWVFSSGFFDHFQRSAYIARTRNRKKKPDFVPLSTLGAGAYSFWFINAGLLIGFAIFLLLI